MNKKILLMVSTIAALGTLTLAAWIASWSVSGNFIATSGAKPEIQTTTWDINITSDEPVNKTFIYTNTDGEKTVYLNLIDNIASADPNCIYEPNVDVQFHVNSGIWLNTTDPIPIVMHSGDNSILIKVTPSHYRCSLTGNYSIGFTV